MSASASQSAPVVVPETPIEPYIPAPPRSRFAKHALELSGDIARAERLDNCGRHMDLRDVNDHRKRKYQHCMDQFCLYCSTRISKTTFDRWEDALRFTKDGGWGDEIPPHFTYVEASIPHAERSREQVSAEFETLDHRLHNLIEGSFELHPRWEVTPGYQQHNFILRVLYLGDNIGAPQWTAMFPPTATVRVITFHLSQLSHVFQNKLLAVSLSKDPIDRAEQSVLFRGVKRFRAHGITTGAGKTSPEEIDLFADTDLPANISSEMLEELDHKLISAGPHDPEICPECGEPYTEQSQWFAKDAPEPRPHEYVWHPRTVHKHPPS